MSLATATTRALVGIDAVKVTVETHLSAGLPGFAIVGLPEAAVKESKERVRSAILNSGLEFPACRITVNLAPADIPKTGGRYDLAIAVTILTATGQIPADKLSQLEILGELALNGDIREITGAIPALIAASKIGNSTMLPAGNLDDAHLVGHANAIALQSLTQVVAYLHGAKDCGQKLTEADASADSNLQAQTTFLQETDIRGQLLAKRGIQIAAAGQHNLLMMGPPGCGKTLLANTLVALLPPLTAREALEVATIRSVAGETLAGKDWYRRPLRTPHHGSTAAALVGGGNRIKPGEVSLAHCGVLFLDELTEFKAGVLDGLREPLEAGEISISRANQRVVFPAAFQLLAAMNPCPCGHANDAGNACRCRSDQVERYLGKLSGPFLDRIDMLVELAGLSSAEILGQEADLTDWVAVRQRIADCRQRQTQRQQKLNSQLNPAELKTYCGLGKPLQRLLEQAIDRLRLSARSVHRLLKVARTVADYEGTDGLGKAHLLEALSYRQARLRP